MKIKLLIFAILVVGLGIWICVHQRNVGVIVPGSRSESTNSKPQVVSVPVAKQIPRAAPAVSKIAPANVEPNLSPAELIVNKQGIYSRRLSAIDTLTTNLSAFDEEALRAFLLQRDPADAEQSGRVLKNHLLDALCGMIPPPGWLGATLIELYEDHGQDIVIRDYAVQHLSSYYEQISNGGSVDSMVRKQVGDALWEALDENDSSIAGTSLLGLRRLSKELPQDFNLSEVSKAALKLAESSNTGPLSRATAFQICALLNINDALPSVWQAAQSAGTVPVRISAIQALGTLGDSRIKPFLLDVLNGSEQRLKLPAQAALKQITERERTAIPKKS